MAEMLRTAIKVDDTGERRRHEDSKPVAVARVRLSGRFATVYPNVYDAWELGADGSALVALPGFEDGARFASGLFSLVR